MPFLFTKYRTICLKSQAGTIHYHLNWAALTNRNVRSLCFSPLSEGRNSNIFHFRTRQGKEGEEPLWQSSTDCRTQASSILHILLLSSMLRYSCDWRAQTQQLTSVWPRQYKVKWQPCAACKLLLLPPGQKWLNKGKKEKGRWLRTSLWYSTMQWTISELILTSVVVKGCEKPKDAAFSACYQRNFSRCCLRLQWHPLQTDCTTMTR